MSDQTSQVRAGRNQSLFRSINERLEGIAESFQHVAETGAFSCECADLGCIETLSMTVNEYEAVRSHPNQFVVLPGHVYPEVERVLAETDHYVLVAKIGEGAEVAAKHDPRSGP